MGTTENLEFFRSIFWLLASVNNVIYRWNRMMQKNAWIRVP